MRTRNEMYDYAKQNMPFVSEEMEGGINIIVSLLENDEEVLFLFEGLHNFKDVTLHDGGFTYALTNKRFIGVEAAKKLFQKDKIYAVPITSLNDLRQIQIGSYNSVLMLNINGQIVNIYVNPKNLDVIYNGICNVLKMVKPELFREAPSNTSTVSNVDEILKYKQLLDQGIITQEEFEAKKKQLLNL